MPAPKPGTALSLSGGGFRALHWHLGSLRALNARGWLPRLSAISGVSAGSICAAWLGLRWDRLQFNADGVAANLDTEIIDPLTSLAQRRIGIVAVAATLLPPLGGGNRLLARELDVVMWRGAQLADLPRHPRIVLSAVDLEIAEHVQLSADGVAHPHWGQHTAPGLPLTAAVAASCAFTPFTAPAVLRLDASGWSGGSGPGRLLLADGVLLDNMGLDAIWDYSELLVSDSSLPRKLTSPVRPSWHSILVHAQRAQFQFAHDLRLRQLRQQLTSGERSGLYWGLGGALYRAAGSAAGTSADALGEVDATRLPGCTALPDLLRTPGYLLRLPTAVQQGLEQCSFALCEAALAGYHAR